MRILAIAVAVLMLATARADVMVKNGEKIAFLGDSITELGNWPAGYVNLVMEGLKRAGVKDAVKIPAGRSGDRSNRMLARIDGVLKQKPDWILISCGVNDVWHREHKDGNGKHTGVDFPDYVANMRAMYDKCDAAGAKVVVLTATMITEDANDQKNKWLVEYNDFLRAEAKKRNYLLVDLNAAMWAKLNEIRKTDKEPGNKLTKDGVHMTYKGDCQMAATILTAFGADAKIGGSLEATCQELVEAGKNLKGGDYTWANLSLAERARLRAVAKAKGKSDMDYALDLYVEGIELAATLGSLPPEAPSAPKRENPTRAAALKVADGAKVCFVGDYYSEAGAMTGRYIDQVMRGLAAAGVAKATRIPGWMRWEKSAKMLARLDKVLAKKPDWIVFLHGNDDRMTNSGPLVPFAETKANFTAAFDKFAATGAKVVLCTLRPGEGTAETDAFLRDEAAKRGWLLADVAKAQRETKANLDYGNFEGHSLVAKTILTALGVDAETVDFTRRAVTETPGSDGVNIPTSMNQAKHAREVAEGFASRKDLARDIVVALLDPAKRKAWEAQPPAVRRILTLKTRKGLPRAGEGDLVRLKDKSILFAYTEYVGDSMLDHAPAHIVARRSTDGGATWTEPQELFPREGKQNDMSVSLLRLADGRLALFNLRKNSDADCIPVVRFSTDEGQSWGNPTDCLPADAKEYYVLNNARAYQLKSGRLVLPLAQHSAKDKGGNFKGRLSCALSDDAGKTWRKGTEYEVRDEKGKRITVQEPGVIALKDGRLYLYARTDVGRQWQAFSKDGGETWTDFGPSSLYGPCAPATLRRLDDGRLLAVWNDHEGHPEYAKRGGWGRVPLTLAYSADEGLSWTDRRVIEPDLNGFYCYIATLLDGDDLLLHYYCKPCLTDSCVTRVPGGAH